LAGKLVSEGGLMRRLKIGLMVGVLLSCLTVGACISIDQEACPPNRSVCMEGDQWVCLEDGSGWERVAICPRGRCENRKCVLPPPPTFDPSSIVIPWPTENNQETAGTTTND